MLANPADLAARTGRPLNDTQLLLALQRASDRFRGAVNHQVSLVTADVVVLDGDGSTTLLLPGSPVVAVAEVRVSGVVVTDWEMSADGRLRRQAGWPNTYGSVQVVYTHGYGSVPPDIEDVVLWAAERELTVQPGVQSMAVGGESVTYARGVGASEMWTEVVARHRTGRDRP